MLATLSSIAEDFLSESSCLKIQCVEAGITAAILFMVTLSLRTVLGSSTLLNVLSISSRESRGLSFNSSENIILNFQRLLSAKSKLLSVKPLH